MTLYQTTLTLTGISQKEIKSSHRQYQKILKRLNCILKMDIIMFYTMKNTTK